jgi:hypothetical protein
VHPQRDSERLDFMIQHQACIGEATPVPLFSGPQSYWVIFGFGQPWRRDFWPGHSDPRAAIDDAMRQYAEDPEGKKPKQTVITFGRGKP